jgi:DNA polymerase-3 subunit epsilon
MKLKLKNLQLPRPLAILDLETTGTDPAHDRIVELAVIKLHPCGRCDTFARRLNPGITIPTAASIVHGITNADVHDQPRFAQIATELYHFLAGADLAGFGITQFDLPLLTSEFRRAGLCFRVVGRRVLDALEVYRRREPRNLASAVQLYCQREHTGAHSATADVKAALAVLDAQVGFYALPSSVDALHAALVSVDIAGRFCQDGEVTRFAFGKYRGRPLKEIAASDPGYLRWMVSQPFLDDTLALVHQALTARG